MTPSIDLVKDYFFELQTKICDTLAEIDARGGQSGEDVRAGFSIEDIRQDNGAHSRPRVLDGHHIERGAVQYSHSIGASLPSAASERNPHLAGRGFQAAAISMIMHPRNPYVPTFHANLRFFIIDDENWYFGGGFDLTPYYPFREDVVHWHQQAKAACDPFGEDVYPKLKKWCDDYFYLDHRNEARGVGGVFFDDWTQGGFEQSLAFTKSIGDAILPAYVPIVEKRLDTPYGEREEEFQLYRRGRYAEFNLAIDRGTRYGLQSGRRIESVLASMPPRAIWKYNWHPQTGTPEAALYDDFLPAQDWI
ncbi:MAG: oxygen-dependent coproporphyrinogen oxidase [Pseudomonadales bacterium]|nr:oxygen-dependent coproporphyrinogen oxidase [Pseudomonadales bacterium]MDG1443320.1 oxygen-dependent coproporphyrinogen oxidase [Pseudomonadales bacterium]